MTPDRNQLELCCPFQSGGEMPDRIFAHDGCDCRNIGWSANRTPYGTEYIRAATAPKNCDALVKAVEQFIDECKKDDGDPWSERPAQDLFKPDHYLQRALQAHRERGK